MDSKIQVCLSAILFHGSWRATVEGVAVTAELTGKGVPYTNKIFTDMQPMWKLQYSYNHCEYDIGMGLVWSGNETHQEVRVVKVMELLHEVEDA